MIPAPFDYVRAATVVEALEALGGEGAVPLAGGHSLLLDMKLRRRSPRTLVDISQVPQLTGVDVVDGRLVLGAAVTYGQLERSDVVRRLAPLLAHSASTVGDRQVRARGTVGGSVINADPAADLPATLLALDAVYVVAGPTGTREVPAREMHLGAGLTALRPGELLVHVRVAPTPEARWSYQKFRQRSHQWAVVGVVAIAGSASGDHEGSSSGVRIAMMGMGSTAHRADVSERSLAAGGAAQDAAALAAEGLDVTDDLRASARYRRHLASVLTARALAEVGVA